jgi:hypothetical protein
MAEVEKRHYDSGEPSLKCARLENVIPTPARPLKKQVKQQPPTVHKPVAIATPAVAVRAAATHPKGVEGVVGAATKQLQQCPSWIS